MRKIALIVEGAGDYHAIPSLIAKVSHAYGLQIYASEPPIKSGEAAKLRREGELERYLRLALTRHDAQEVLLLLDLDDGCVAEISADFNQRASRLVSEFRKPIHICFALKEYECWFLRSIGSIAGSLPEYGIDEGLSFQDAHTIRGAKQALNKACKLKTYKETRDQLLFTKKIDVMYLSSVDRAFRKLVKSVTGLSYPEMQQLYSAGL